MLDLHHQPSRQSLGIVQCLSNRLNRRSWDILCRKPAYPFAGRSALKERTQRRNQHLAMFRTQGVGAKTWVSPQRLRRIHHPKKSLPKRIGAYGGDKMPAVSAAEHLVRNNAGMRIAPPLGRLACIQVIAA